GAAPCTGARQKRRVQAGRAAPRRGGGRLEPTGRGREADPRARGAKDMSAAQRRRFERLFTAVPYSLACRRPHRPDGDARGRNRPAVWNEGMERPSYGYSAEDNPDPQAPPVCPRHPDRVSYVRCKRCDRPACPDCQRPTSVGTLCVDCEREISRQQASTRPRNAMGASMGRRTPYVTYTVIALCVL